MSSDTRPAAANEDEWTGNFSRFPHLQFYGCFGGAEGMLLELREEIQKARVEHRRGLIERERRIAAGEVDADSVGLGQRPPRSRARWPLGRAPRSAPRFCTFVDSRFHGDLGAAISAPLERRA